MSMFDWFKKSKPETDKTAVEAYNMICGALETMMNSKEWTQIGTSAALAAYIKCSCDILRACWDVVKDEDLSDPIISVMKANLGAELMNNLKITDTKISRDLN